MPALSLAGHSSAQPLDFRSYLEQSLRDPFVLDLRVLEHYVRDE